MISSGQEMSKCIMDTTVTYLYLGNNPDKIYLARIQARSILSSGPDPCNGPELVSFSTMAEYRYGCILMM